jgi:hypothetical protein
MQGREQKRRSFEERPGKSALTNECAQRAAVELAMQRNRKRNLAATHEDVTAALPRAFEAVFA